MYICIHVCVSLSLSRYIYIYVYYVCIYIYIYTYVFMLGGESKQAWPRFIERRVSLALRACDAPWYTCSYYVYTMLYMMSTILFYVAFHSVCTAMHKSVCRVANTCTYTHATSGHRAGKVPGSILPTLLTTMLAAESAPAASSKSPIAAIAGKAPLPQLRQGAGP